MPAAHQPSPVPLTVDRVAQICSERGVKFTALRRIAFEALLEFNGPAGAYDLIKALQRRLGRPVGPPTAYRALEFLQENGFVTRVETRNAFLPSTHPDDPATGAFFLCNHCGATLEMDLGGLELELARRAAQLGFQVGRRVVEFQGTCADCQETTSAAEGQSEVVKGGRG